MGSVFQVRFRLLGPILALLALGTAEPPVSRRKSSWN